MVVSTRWARDLTARRLLVFGGSGFLGSRLCYWAFALNGQDVVATHLSSPPGRDDGYRWVECDITDHAAVHELVERVQPTVVVNAAYRQSGDEMYEVSARGATNVAAAASANGARCIHISTDLVFDGTMGRPYREDDPVSPINAYGRAKAEAESLVREAAPKSLIVRTSLIYGDPSGPQEQLVRRAIEHGDVSFFTDEWRSPVNVGLLADSVGRLARSEHSGILHVAGADRMNRLHFARLLAESLDLDPNLLSGRTQDPALGPRAKDVSLDVSAAQALGLVPGDNDSSTRSPPSSGSVSS